MVHTNSLISAVIPVFNRPEQIAEAIRSVLDQTWKHLELIIGDDGSTDLTLATIKRLTKENHQGDVSISVLELDHTGCPGAVRNRCVQVAQGELLAFLDSDDLWAPEKLEKQAASFLHDPTLQISHTREEWNRKGRIISQSKLRHRREGDLFLDSLKKCIIGPSTTMMRKAFYEKTGGFREDLEIAEDYEYWLRITAETEIRFLDEPLTVKRAGHDNQLSEKYGHIELFRIQGLKALVDRGAFQGWHAEAAAKELSRKCLVYGRGCIKRGKASEGQTYLDLSGFYEVLAEN